MVNFELADLGRYFSSLRRHHNINQRDIVSATGMSRTTISQFENGKLNELGFNRIRMIFSCLPQLEHANQDFSEVLTKLGSFVRDYRETVANLSVTEFAALCKVPPGAIISIESSDGSVPIFYWLSVLSEMQVLGHVVESAQPSLSLLDSMFDVAKIDGEEVF
jgi:predicted transcriptional regulator